jgi:hypothetical protein
MGPNEQRSTRTRQPTMDFSDAIGSEQSTSSMSTVPWSVCYCIGWDRLSTCNIDQLFQAKTKNGESFGRTENFYPLFLQAVSHCYATCFHHRVQNIRTEKTQWAYSIFFLFRWEIISHLFKLEINLNAATKNWYKVSQPVSFNTNYEPLAGLLNLSARVRVRNSFGSSGIIFLVKSSAPCARYWGK